jgi:GAF domain-containing protein
MAENIPDLSREPKHRAYPQLFAYIVATLTGIDDDIAGMATIAAMIHQSLGHLWTGFYRVVEPNLLRIGPYQGSLGCLEIQFGKGVCGTAAAERRTIIVPDVSRFPGHIACDARSKSEVVVPVFDRGGALIAVLDVDSARRSAFDQLDADGLERIVRWFAGEGRG